MTVALYAIVFAVAFAVARVQARADIDAMPHGLDLEGRTQFEFRLKERLHGARLSHREAQRRKREREWAPVMRAVREMHETSERVGRLL